MVLIWNWVYTYVIIIILHSTLIHRSGNHGIDAPTQPRWIFWPRTKYVCVSHSEISWMHRPIPVVKITAILLCTSFSGVYKSTHMYIHYSYIWPVDCSQMMVNDINPSYIILAVHGIIIILLYWYPAYLLIYIIRLHYWQSYYDYESSIRACTCVNWQLDEWLVDLYTWCTYACKEHAGT